MELLKKFFSKLIDFLFPVYEEGDLSPDVCQCTHDRCAHEKGRGRCYADHPPDSETDYWTRCACRIFIKDDRDDDDDEPDTPSPEELERLYVK